MELDMQEVYGVDLSDRDLMHARSWRWLRQRVLGLLSTSCRVQRVLNPERPPSDQAGGA